MAGKGLIESYSFTQKENEPRHEKRDTNDIRIVLLCS